jgi:hypothetical protein
MHAALPFPPGGNTPSIPVAITGIFLQVKGEISRTGGSTVPEVVADGRTHGGPTPAADVDNRTLSLKK